MATVMGIRCAASKPKIPPSHRPHPLRNANFLPIFVFVINSIRMEYKFDAVVEIVGINPFVRVPEGILEKIFEEAGRDKGPIPVAGKINNAPYKQTLMRFRGLWRLYINMKMLKNSPRRIGENVALTIAFDPKKRTIEPHPKLLEALGKNEEAKRVFDGLTPSKRHEIVRYISFLKSEEGVERNVGRAIGFLLGEGGFGGRERV